MARKALLRLIIYLYNNYVPPEMVNAVNEYESPPKVKVNISEFDNKWNKFALSEANKDRSGR